MSATVFDQEMIRDDGQAVSRWFFSGKQGVDATAKCCVCGHVVSLSDASVHSRALINHETTCPRDSGIGLLPHTAERSK